MEQILKSHKFKSKALTWEQLRYKARLDLLGQTIYRVIGTIDYYKYIAYRKGQVNNRLKKKQLEQAILIKNRYPEKDNQKYIRFSNKYYFRQG